MVRPTQVLLIVGGGPAACRTPELVHQLRRRGCAVRVLLGTDAAPYVAEEAIRALTSHPPISPAERVEDLTAWAEGLCWAPLAAQSLRLVERLTDPHGSETLPAPEALDPLDPRLAALIRAFDGPRVLAVGAEGWERPAVQGAVAVLARHGLEVVPPARGELAEPALVAERMTAHPVEFSLAGRHFLISAGPTYEPVDPVRFLGNRSSGKMGFAIAAEAARRGAHTCLVAGPVSLETPPGVERVDVATAIEMYDAVRDRAPSADCIVKTAAVADFRPKDSVRSKIKKEKGVPRIELVANPDILASLPEVAPNALRVGFAAETDFSAEEAWGKLDRKGAHLLVWNDVSQRGIGFGADHNEVTVYRRGVPPLTLVRRPKRDIATALLEIFAEALVHREAEALSQVV